MSPTSVSGLDGVSRNSSRVSGRMAAAQAKQAGESVIKFGHIKQALERYGRLRLDDLVRGSKAVRQRAARLWLRLGLLNRTQRARSPADRAWMLLRRAQFFLWRVQRLLPPFSSWAQTVHSPQRRRQRQYRSA